MTHNYVKNKISKSLGILYKIRRYLDNTTLTNMYYSCFSVSYILCWDMGKFSQIKFRSTSENSEKMHQNYFLFGIFSSLRATISEIKYLHYNANFEKLVIQRISLMMFKCRIWVLPSSVSALFQYNFVIHTHNTRISKFIHTTICRSEATYRTFSYIFGIISLTYSELYLSKCSHRCFIRLF